MTASPEPPILLTPDEAAEILRCTRRALYRQVSAGHIPPSCVVRVGRRLLFVRTEILAWLTAGSHAH